jgi:polynucleotide 5'-hydroxyl-kinase GRC3/NOL9
VDRGKSTYCDFLAQRCLEAGRRVAVLDADVGQKAIGPPATLTLGYPQLGQPLTATPPAAWYFIGAITPVGHLLPVVVGVKRLLDTAQATCLIVNTTGLVHGIGRVLKSYKIDTVQPDAIVALEQGRELRALLHAYRHYHILRLPVSTYAIAKTSAQRRATRAQAFGAYFAAASMVTLPLRQVIFQRGLLFTGRQVVRKDEIYTEHTSEGMLAVGTTKQPTPSDRHVLPLGFEHHLLCGVANRQDRGLGLALIDHIDFANETLTIYTPVPAAQIGVLQWGELYIRPDGSEGGTPVPRSLFM